MFAIPTTKYEMMTTLGEIFYYYRIRRESIEDLILTDLTLERMQFDKLTDSQLLNKAEKLVASTQEREKLKYKEDINSKIKECEVKKADLTRAYNEQVNNVNLLYQKSEEQIEQKAYKNHLSGSTILLDKLAELENQKNLRLSTMDSEYNQQLSEYNASIQALTLKLNNVDSYFSSIFAKELYVKYLELSGEQEKTEREVFKYNNEIDEKEKKNKNSNLIKNTDIRLQYAKLNGEFFTKDQLVELGYYDEVIDCVCGYYDSLPAQEAYNDIRKEPKLAVYLDDYYQSILYLYQSRLL